MSRATTTTTTTTTMTTSSKANGEHNNADYDYLIKLLALGDSGVGKTSFLFQYTDAKFETKFVSTIGVDFSEKRILFRSGDADRRGQRVLLQLWDTAGQERFRSLTSACFRNALGFILMFDLTSERSFLNVRDWLEQLRLHAYCDRPDVLLVGNKVDLAELRAVSWARANQEAERLGVGYLECSAASGLNVSRCVDALLGQVMERMRRVAERPDLPLGLAPRRGARGETAGCSC